MCENGKFSLSGSHIPMPAPLVNNNIIVATVPEYLLQVLLYAA